MSADAFELHMRTLCAGFDVPCTAERLEAYRKAFGRLDPIGFERLVQYCLSEDGPPRMPTVAKLWASRSEMRARAPREAPAADPWQGDAWDIAANHHLLGHITQKLASNPSRYGRPPTWHGMRVSKFKNADASPEFIANVQALVEAKKFWAADMRDLAQQHGEVPIELQRKIWADYMAQVGARVAA